MVPSTLILISASLCQKLPELYTKLHAYLISLLLTYLFGCFTDTLIYISQTNLNILHLKPGFLIVNGIPATQLLMQEA